MSSGFVSFFNSVLKKSWIPKMSWKKTQVKQVKVLKKCRRSIRSPEKCISSIEHVVFFLQNSNGNEIFFKFEISKKFRQKFTKYRETDIFFKCKKIGKFPNFEEKLWKNRRNVYVPCKYHDVLCWWYIYYMRVKYHPRVKSMKFLTKSK